MKEFLENKDRVSCASAKQVERARRQWILWGGTWLILTGTLFFSSSCSKHQETEVESPAPVQITTATQDTIRQIINGDGVLYPWNQTPLTPKITSPVQEFFVNRGDHVKEGQLLALLEKRDLTALALESKHALTQSESNYRSIASAAIPESVVRAQAEVEAARQTMETAKKVLESREQLFREGALARRQVDESQVNFAQANAAFLSAQEHLRALQSVSKDEQIKTAIAQVDSAKAHFESLEAQLSYAEIRSPISGVIADRPLWVGDIASPGTPLLTVMDISRVVARVNVPQGQAHLIQVGQPAEVLMTDSQEQIAGRVMVVSPATDANSTTVQVWVEIANSGDRLKPGASVHARIITEIFKTATVVPASALLPGEEGGTALLVIDSESRAHLRLVKLGVREGEKVQVLSGVRPGEEIVTVGGLGVEDKAKVKIIDPSVKEADEEEPGDAKGSESSEPGKDKKKEEAKPKQK